MRILKEYKKLNDRIAQLKKESQKCEKKKAKLHKKLQFRATRAIMQYNSLRLDFSLPSDDRWHDGKIISVSSEDVTVQYEINTHFGATGEIVLDKSVLKHLLYKQAINDLIYQEVKDGDYTQRQEREKRLTAERKVQEKEAAKKGGHEIT